MNVPISGIILVPLTLGIFCFSSYTAEWAIFTAVFQGAALVNMGGGFSIGLSPYFFVTALVALGVVPQLLTGKICFLEDEPVRVDVHGLIIFIAWCVLSAFLLPVMFQGIPVDSPKVGVDASYYTQLPLQWSFSNAGQAGYMMLNFIFVVRLLQLCVSQKRLERLVNAFSWSGVFAAAVALYQVFCHRFGLSFPSWLFNSNQAWAELPNQFVGPGFSRINGTFVEPSAAAVFFSAWSVFELSLAMGLGRQGGRHWLWATVGTLVLVATASTTGYITAALIWVVMAWDCMSNLLLRGFIKTKATLIALGLGSAGLAALAFLPGVWLLLDALFFSKGQSASGLHRSATFGRAVGVFLNSWGLGVGLGSNRAMSAFFYVLSNLGWPGLILIGWLLSRLYSQVRVQLRSVCDSVHRTFLYGFTAAFSANLLALILSGAEISQPHLWILWGLLLGTLRHDWLRDRRLDGGVSAAAIPPIPSQLVSADLRV